MWNNPGTPGGRTKDSPEEVMSRPPEGTRVGQSRPGPVEKHEDHVPGKSGEFGSSMAIEDTGATPGPDNRAAETIDTRGDYRRRSN